MALVKLTTKLSIITQALSFFPAVRGVIEPTPPGKQLLKEILKVELAVTLVQFLFYLFLFRSFNLDKMATIRYYDWFFTTPAMLFSMVAYFVYAANKATTIPEILRDYKAPLIRMFLANFVMLLVGYLAETGVMDRNLAAVAGFAAFAVVFRTMYTEFRTEESDGLFKMLTLVWGLYGVAFMLPTAEKNLSYNALDIVSKNFFAVFLSYKLV
jgi:hypothetical protein